MPKTTDPAIARVLDDAIALYVTAASHEKEEIRTFGSLVSGLIDDVGPQERRAIAERLAPRADIPVALARRLAMDEASIAAPVIVHSPMLTSADLVQIMRCGPTHVRLVAERLDLGPEATRILDRSTRSTRPAETPADVPARPMLATVLDPPPAPDTTPARTAPTPNHSASEHRRPDPGDDLAAFLDLDQAARWRAIQDAATAAALAGTRSRRRPADATAGPRLFALLAAADRAGFRGALAEALAIGRGAIDRLLADPHGEALAVALAALGVDERTATSILLLSFGERATLGQMQDLSALTARVGWRTAEHLVGKWRGRTADRAEVQRQLDPAERRNTRPETAAETERGTARETVVRRGNGRPA